MNNDHPSKRIQIAKLFGKKPWDEKELAKVKVKQPINKAYLNVIIHSDKLSEKAKVLAEKLLAEELNKRFSGGRA